MFQIKQGISSRWFKVIFALWLTILLIYRITICFSYLPELSNGESNNIWKAINVANGKPIYTNPEELPLEVFQYTPISQLPIIGIAKLLNKESVDYVYLVTVYGRLYELCANILLLILIYQLSVKWLQNTKTTSATTSLVIFSLLTNPAFTVRPDATLLLFLGLSIWAYIKMEDSNQFGWIFITSSLIIVSFFTKQDGLLIAGPMGIRLLSLKKWRLFFTLSTITLALLMLSIYFSPIIFGDNFYKCVFEGLKNTSSIKQIISVFDRAYGFYMVHIIFGLIFAFNILIKNHKDRIALFSILSIYYFFVALATSSKSGSWVNYYTPFIIYSSIVILYFSSKFIVNKEISNRTLNLLIAILIAVFFIFKQIYVYTSPFLKENNGKKEYYTHYKTIQKIKNQLAICAKDNIIIANQFDRNFLADNSIMINTEYYSYASYKYESFKSKKKKKINYIIYKQKEKPLIDYLTYFFNIDKENFKQIKTEDYIILKAIY